MDRRQVERELRPGVAVVGGVPDVAVAEARVEVAGRGGIGQQRVGHVRDRVGQAAG